MPPRTKTAHSTTTAGNEAPIHRHESPPQRTLRTRADPDAARCVDVARARARPARTLRGSASCARVGEETVCQGAGGRRTAVPSTEGEAQEPRRAWREREDVRTKRARVRCPAEATPTRKGKSKASSPSSRSSPDTQHDSPTSTHTRTQKSTPAKNAHGQSGRTTRRTGRVGVSHFSAWRERRRSEARERTTVRARRDDKDECWGRRSVTLAQETHQWRLISSSPASLPLFHLIRCPQCFLVIKDPASNPMTLRSATPSRPTPPPPPTPPPRAQQAGARHCGRERAAEPEAVAQFGGAEAGADDGAGGVQGSPLSSPLTSPARERGEVLGAALAPWEREREVKKEPAEMEGVLPRSERKRRRAKGTRTSRWDKKSSTRRETPRRRPHHRADHTLLVVLLAPPPLAHITTTSTSTSQLVLDAPSPRRTSPVPFAPPALPLPLPSTPSADELSNLALAPPPAPLGLSLGHGLALDTDTHPSSTWGCLWVGLGTPDALGGIAPGPPVSPDWPLPHAPFALAESSSSSSAGGSSGRGCTRPSLRRTPRRPRPRSPTPSARRSRLRPPPPPP
ncbi:hypothetical protein B0H14DRAFT_3430712, partial [Mycena olivaceomarginata]